MQALSCFVSLNVIRAISPCIFIFRIRKASKAIRGLTYILGWESWAFHGHCSVIYVSCSLHLIHRRATLHLGRAPTGLSSPEPGSLICGVKVSKKEKGDVPFALGSSAHPPFPSPAGRNCGMEQRCSERGRGKSELICGPRVRAYLLLHVR